MKSAVFNIGRKVYIRGRHCEKCGFNITDDKYLDKAIRLFGYYEGKI